MSYIKSEYEIEKIRKSCKIAAEILEAISPYIKVGITTEEIDTICKAQMQLRKANSACLGYHGFPKSVCVSKNNIVCHGIPSKNEILQDGDIVNVDVSVEKDGYYGDTSKMFLIGNVKDSYKKLCQVTKKCLYSSIKIIKPGVQLNQIGKCIQGIAEKNGFSVVKEYCGHGIGKKLHEKPQVLHYYTKKNQSVLKNGMIFTIEPMINFGKRFVYLEKDNWTVKTKDSSFSAQYEHTVLVTKKNFEILTKRKEEEFL
ncbi:type I methionyl aminopeptidase [bacterium endosymbiont of Pedicinus badii]|uniref:type I methionyl aminopeptidase n=1 Tax=bacterium endosymbiont of Pedicinus badii TaxID=1719126 RepID=UPI0009BA57CE|nr:type I methionyl aminopeptidase [bacterium endosymbiont of Pedicinus badii]OQM34002.1 methionine aminopeptidase [bacterium endosymbiont of Pedicinus badii]